MLALVAAFEGFLATHPADFAEFSASDWHLSGAAASRQAGEAEILCVGDSLLKFGLVPEVLEARTGLKTFNLSLLGGQAPTSYFLLRRALEAGARPRAILVDCQDLPSKPCFPDVRGLGLTPQMRCWPELLTVAEAADLAWTARDASFFGSVVARSLLPSFRSRREVRTGLGQLLKKGETSSRRRYLAQERNWSVNRGSLLMPRRASNPTTLGPDRADLPREDWSPDPVTATYVRRLLRLARERQILVFWLIPPTTPEHEGLRVKTGQHEYFTRFAEALRDEFPDLVVVDGRSPGYGRGVFIDDSHLDRPGATAFSVEVAEVVSASLRDGPPQGRWAVLPPYRERATPGGAEDMEQSRLALRPGRGGGRR